MSKKQKFTQKFSSLEDLKKLVIKQPDNTQQKPFCQTIKKDK